MNLTMVLSTILFDNNSYQTTRRTLRTSSSWSWQGMSKSKLNISNHHNFSVNLPIVFIFFYFVKKVPIQPPGEPREHHLGEVLQGRSRSKFNIILYYLIWKLCFFGSGFNNPNYLVIKKDLISKLLDSMIQNILIGKFKTSRNSVYLYCWNSEQIETIKYYFIVKLWFLKIISFRHRGVIVYGFRPGWHAYKKPWKKHIHNFFHDAMPIQVIHFFLLQTRQNILQTLMPKNLLKGKFSCIKYVNQREMLLFSTEENKALVKKL